MEKWRGSWKKKKSNKQTKRKKEKKKLIKNHNFQCRHCPVFAGKGSDLQKKTKKKKKSLLKKSTCYGGPESLLWLEFTQ